VKKLLFFTVICIAALSFQTQSGVAISVSTTATSDALAISDVQSTTHGMLVPRITEADNNSIFSPAIRLMIKYKNIIPVFSHCLVVVTGSAVCE
jgi:parvulin-like peptidyl-prolyl isomerase